MRTAASRLVTAIMSFMLTMVLILGCFYFYMMVSLPSVSMLKDVRMQTPLAIYTQDRQLIAFFGEKRRMPITLDQAPPLLIKAILVTEDKRFFEHPGVDVIGLGRAAIRLIATGKKSQGASTITMQVARNFFLTRKKTFSRKINEILLAIKISQTFSKKKVLSLYLNKIYLGHRAYGVAAAAQVYYGKSLAELNLPQIAMLAGLPQAPSRENPITNPVLAKKRRNHVLARLLADEVISKAQYEVAKAAPITAKYHGLQVAVKAPYAAEMVREELVKRYGGAAYTSGFLVRTTIDSRLQKQANAVVNAGLLAYDRRHGYRGAEAHWALDVNDPEDLLLAEKRLAAISVVGGLQPALVWQVDAQSIEVILADQQVSIPWSGLQWAKPWLSEKQLGPAPTSAQRIVKVGDVVRVSQSKSGWQLRQIPQAQAALVAMDDKNGAIRALVGGFSFAHSHYNRATQAKRQPGSSFKPFIYAAALAKGYTLATTFDDAPVVIEDTGANAWWRPHNSEDRFYGPTRLRVGLVKSRNLLTVRLLQAVGVAYARDYLTRFGFDQAAAPNSLSLALGSGVLSPLALTRAYAMLANGGYAVQGHIIDQLTDGRGQQLQQSPPPVVCDTCTESQSAAPRVMSAEVNYLINSVLQGVITQGTGRRALVLKRQDLAGKTGTTNDQVDAWFAGYGGGMVTTVWVGFDQPSSLGEYGSKAALPMWIDFMRAALRGRATTQQERPGDIVSVRIDPKTGLLAPSGQADIFELFRRQYVPTQTAQATDDSSHPSHRSAAAPSSVDDSSPLF